MIRPIPQRKCNTESASYAHNWYLLYRWGNCRTLFKSTVCSDTDPSNQGEYWETDREEEICQRLFRHMPYLRGTYALTEGKIVKDCNWFIIQHFEIIIVKLYLKSNSILRNSKEYNLLLNNIIETPICTINQAAVMKLQELSIIFGKVVQTNQGSLNISNIIHFIAQMHFLDNMDMNASITEVNF